MAQQRMRAVHGIVIDTETRTILAGAMNVLNAMGENTDPELARVLSEYGSGAELVKLVNWPDNFRVGSILAAGNTRAARQTDDLSRDKIEERRARVFEWAQHNYVNNPRAQSFIAEQGVTRSDGKVSEGYAFKQMLFFTVLVTMHDENLADIQWRHVRANLRPWREVCSKLDTTGLSKANLDNIAAGSANYRKLTEQENGNLKLIAMSGANRPMAAPGTKRVRLKDAQARLYGIKGSIFTAFDRS